MILEGLPTNEICFSCVEGFSHREIVISIRVICHVNQSI